MIIKNKLHVSIIILDVLLSIIIIIIIIIFILDVFYFLK